MVCHFCKQTACVWGGGKWEREREEEKH
jgi:hypothetical protein